MKYKTKVIKGKVLHNYKGRLVLNKPDKAIVKKMVYNTDDDTTTIYYGRENYTFEFVCALIILVLVFAQYKMTDPICNISYDSFMMYVQGKLYLNFENSSESSYTVSCELVGQNKGDIYTKDVKPGGSWYIIECTDPDDKYTLTVSYKVYFIDVIREYPITVHTLDSQLE